MRVLNRQQMQEAERTTIEGGVSSFDLMAKAGKAAALAIVQRYGARAHGRISIFAGPGNNGGDGFVIGRELVDRAESVRVFFLGRRTELSGDASAHAKTLPPSVPIISIVDDADWVRHRLSATDADLLVDALFGTGLTRPLAGVAAAIVADLNSAEAPVVAVDLPSGLSADRSDVPGPVVDADLTVTFGAPKIPLAVTPACTHAGTLVIADIGITARTIETLPGPRIDWLDAESVRPLLKRRRVDSHKGLYGHVLVIGGSRGKVGAAGLAGLAALRAGAGLVTLATPETCWPTAAGFAPEAMTLPLPETIDGTVAEDALPAVLKFEADVIAIGPGLGRSPSTTAFVRGLVERCRLPLVIDADALNAIAGHEDLLEAHVSSDLVITPHPGEMARLADTTTEVVQRDRLGMALKFAARHRAHVVLKGHRTVIATPAGRAFVNTTGNPGMATAGTGDVLTGVIAASFATGRSAVEAATLGVYLHGLAGDLAAARDGEIGLTAGDVIQQLRLATRTLASGHAGPAR